MKRPASRPTQPLLVVAAMLAGLVGLGGPAAAQAQEKAPRRPPPRPQTAPPVQPQPQPQAPLTDPVRPGEVLLRLASDSQLQPLLAKYRLSLVSRFGQRPIYRLQAPADSPLASLLPALSAEPGVLNAEPNAQHQSPEARKNNVFAIGHAQAYAAQWAPLALRLAQAHALSTGVGVRVAVLDTGVDTSHPALAGRLLPGRDFVDGDNDASEPRDPSRLGYGHGTHVAGLVAMVAPGARIMPLRVLDADGTGNAWVLAEALLYAVDPDGNPATDDGAQVINLSLGSLSRTALLDTLARLTSCTLPGPTEPAAAAAEFADPGYNADKTRCANSRGAVVAAAAGNSGSRTLREYPAAEGAYGSIAVAASGADMRLADFSNRGSWVDLAAPGVALTSTIPGGAWGTWSGTSMATPLVAGTAALVRSVQPGTASRTVARRLVCSGSPLQGSEIPQVDPLTAVQNAIARRGCR